MKMRLMLVLLSSVPISYAAISTELHYSSAVAAGKSGDWKKMQERLTPLIIDAPERADLLYDNGVAAYRLGEYEKAAAYFKTAAESGSKNLAQQAHFNRGNSNVALKKYPDAITAYEAVLTLDPNNEPARHNLEKVRQLQERNKESEQDNKESHDQKDDSQNNQNDNHEQKDDGQNDQSKDSKQKDKEGNKKENGGSDSEQSDSGKSAREEQKEEHKKQQKNGNKKDKSDNKANEQKGANKNDELGNGHDSSSGSKKGDSQATKNGEQSQEINANVIEDGDAERKQEENAQLLEKLGSDKKWMATILDRQEKADEKAQKKLVKATIDKELIEHGQNCW